MRFLMPSANWMLPWVNSCSNIVWNVSFISVASSCSTYFSMSLFKETKSWRTSRLVCSDSNPSAFITSTMKCLLSCKLVSSSLENAFSLSSSSFSRKVWSRIQGYTLVIEVFQLLGFAISCFASWTCPSKLARERQFHKSLETRSTHLARRFFLTFSCWVSPPFSIA